MLKKVGFMLVVLVALGFVLIPYFKESYPILLRAVDKLRGIPPAPEKPTSKTLLITTEGTEWEQPVDATSAPSSPLQAWLIQMGSFKESSNASQLVQSLQTQGIPAYSRTVTTDAKTFSKVYVGPYIQRSEADAMLEKLQQHSQLNPRVVAYDPTYAKEE